MKKINLTRKLHKWLALFTGFQLLIWSVTGLYMTIIDIEIIHGDHLVSEKEPERVDITKLMSISPELFNQEDDIRVITLQRYFDQSVYKIELSKGTVIIDAFTGMVKEPLTRATISQQASEIYAGDANVESIDLLESYPGEIGGKKLPVWRVSYDDWLNSTLYFHYQTGQLLKKRTDLWRVFDVFWILHILDYLGSKGIVGYIFRVFSIGVLLMSLFGLGLLYFRLRKEPIL